MRFVIVLLLVAACVRAEQTPLADESLNAEAYEALGFPPIDKPWRGSEALAALGVVEQLAVQSPSKLPRFESPKSGKVFARMVSEENYKYLRDKTVPINQRIPAGLQLLQGANNIMKSYFTVLAKNQRVDKEVLEGMNYCMSTTLVLDELVEEFIPTIDKTDGKYEVRMRGMMKMQASMADQVKGALLILTEKQTYRTEHLTTFAQQLAASLPKLARHMDQAARAHELKKLGAQAEAESDLKFKAALEALHEKMSDAK